MNKYSIYNNSDYFNNLSDKQKKLFLAAVDLFSSKGFSRTTTAEIAKKAQVSEGLLFKTFDNKENLLKSIIKPIALNILPPTIDMAFNGYGELDLKFFINQYYREKITFIAKNEKLVQILIREIIFDPTIIKTYQAVLPNMFWENTNTCLNQLKSKKLIIDWENKYLFRSLNSALINYILRNYIFQTRLNPDSVEYTIQATYKALKPD